MSQVRIVFLDPRGSLEPLREPLTRRGLPVEVLAGVGELMSTPPHGSAPAPAVVLLDGDPGSGLAPDVLARLAELMPEMPPVAVAVVPEVHRGRAWLQAGAWDFLLTPVAPEELLAEVDRWLRLDERLRAGSKRLEALRKFFAMFAHDLKNPLNAISGYCELVCAHPQLPADAREDLLKVQRNIDLLSTMAQGLLEMARGNARLRVAPREADLTMVVREAAEMMRVRAFSRSIELRVRADVGPVEARIDSPRIIEALANVLDNAIKFSPERSTIDVGLSVEEREVTVTIDDEGPGIPPAEREGVFDRFSQAASHGPQGGLGLGLSIARDIVVLHGGAIWVEGRSPRGTRLAIRLPRSGVEAPEGRAILAGAHAAEKEVHP